MAGPLPVPGAGLAALAPLDARRAEHRGERPVGARRLRSLPGHACPTASSSRSPTTATRISIPSPSADGRQHRLRLRSHRRRAAPARSTCSCSTSTSGGTTQLTSGDWRGRVAALGPRRPDLLHLRPRRRAQRLLGRLRWARAAGRPPPGPAPSTRCRCPTAASLVGGFHDLSWNLYRYPGRLRRPDRSASRACPTRRRPAQWSWDAAGRHHRPASPRGASPTGGGSRSISRRATRW